MYHEKAFGFTPGFETRMVLGKTLRIARWRSRGTATQARPLLFFTGIGANIELLAPLLQRLNGREIVTFDVPGVGGSPQSATPWRTRTICRLADALLSDLGYGEVDVMGVSWGGLIAQQFAFQYRQRTGRLILAATSAGMLMVPGRLSALSKMIDPRRYSDGRLMRENFETLYGGSMPDLQDYLSRMRSPTRLGYFYQLLAVFGWTSLWFLPLIKAPTLILAGSEDRLVRPINARILNLLIRRSELGMVVGGGHLFVLTHIDEVTKAIREFLARPQASQRRSRSALAAP